MVPEFRLRFPISEVAPWAALYDYSNQFVDEADVEAIGARTRDQGWYTLPDFQKVMLWKTPRSRTLCAMNSEASVVSATRLALATPHAHERMNALIGLHGVAFPSASVLLHFAHRDRFPILDFRAIWSLGIDTPPATYSFAFWSAYTRACRSLADEAGVSMRTLDRALWQFSKQQQVPPTRRRLAPRAGEAGHDSRDVAHEGGTTRPPNGGQGSPRPMTDGTPMPRSGRYTHRPDIHARLIETAMRGQLIAYSALVPNRRKVGDFLYRIANEEQAAGRPPVTALVVHKVDGKPGRGFLEAAKWVGFWREGEAEDQVWRRAVEAVHEYWRPKLTDDLE